MSSVGNDDQRLDRILQARRIESLIAENAKLREDNASHVRQLDDLCQTIARTNKENDRLHKLNDELLEALETAVYWLPKECMNAKTLAEEVIAKCKRVKS